MSIIKNKKSFLDGLRASQGNQERRFAERVKFIVYTLHHEITHRTPVHTGQALASYEWSLGTPRDRMATEPSETAPLTPTNHLPIGVEPRRKENQQVADMSLGRLSFRNPYESFWLNNNAPHIGGLEYGLLPEAPLNQRSPAGMFRLALTLMDAKLSAGVFS